MYGSIFRMRIKPGQEQAIVDNFKQWEREYKPQVPGALGGFLFKPDRGSGESIGVAIFKDKVSYMANADNPEQDKWFRTMRELLLADPEWEDGEYVAGSMG